MNEHEIIERNTYIRQIREYTETVERHEEGVSADVYIPDEFLGKFSALLGEISEFEQDT